MSSTRPRLLFSLSAPQGESSSPVSADDYHVQFRLDESYKVRCHVRGLVCLSNLRIIWNGWNETVAHVICKPSTGQLLPLPKVKTKESVRVKTFLGFDPTDEEFKVLTISGGVEHRVVTLGTQTLEWRMVECGIPHHYPIRDGICINGGVYYIGRFHGRDDGIVCFDVRLEKHRVINKAESMRLGLGTLVNYKGKLSVLAADDASLTDRLTGESRYIVLWVLEDAETHECSKHVCVLPQPLWENVVAETILSLSE